MEESLKRRLVGASVLAAMAVILVPMFLEEKPVEYQEITENYIPAKPMRLTQPPKSSPLDVVIVEPEQPVAYRPEKTAEETKPNAMTDTTSTPQIPIKVTKTTVVSVPNDIKTPDQPLTPVVKEGWVVQVGSFSQKNNALKVQQDLEKLGKPVLIQSVTINGRTIHRVLVGLLVDKISAEKAKVSLKSWFKRMGLQGRIRRDKS